MPEKLIVDIICNAWMQQREKTEFIRLAGKHYVDNELYIHVTKL
jgi:hypothetical protein